VSAMNTKRNHILLLVIVLLGLLAAGAVQAAPLAYALPWWTADGGGGAASGGSYSLGSTAGQPDAGVLSGGGFTLAGGYWGGAGQPESHIYLPMLMR